MLSSISYILLLKLVSVVSLCIIIIFLSGIPSVCVFIITSISFFVWNNFIYFPQLFFVFQRFIYFLFKDTYYLFVVSLKVFFLTIMYAVIFRPCCARTAGLQCRYIPVVGNDYGLTVMSWRLLLGSL